MPPASAAFSRIRRIPTTGSGLAAYHFEQARCASGEWHEISMRRLVALLGASFCRRASSGAGQDDVSVGVALPRLSAIDCMHLHLNVVRSAPAVGFSLLRAAREPLCCGAWTLASSCR